MTYGETTIGQTGLGGPTRQIARMRQACACQRGQGFRCSIQTLGST